MSLTDNLVDVVDRIPTQPNRKKIVAADSTVSYATITYADEPTEQGTPINRTIFANINNYVRNENACEIGRLSMTTNPADISDQWLYCNGEDINGYQYPQLFAKSAAATPTSLTNRFEKEFEKNGTAVSDFVELATDVEMTLCAVYGSGKFVMAGKKSSGGIELYYSESASTSVDDWQPIFLQGSETDTLLAMSFENEYFIVSALTTDNYVVLYFSKNLTAWTRKVITLRTLSKITSGSSDKMNEKNSKCCKVKYINNQYVFLIPNGTISSYTSSITVYRLTASELNGTWSETEVSTSAGVYLSLTNIEYGGGYYFFAAGYNFASNSVKPKIHILYATSIAGEWTKSEAITGRYCYAREVDYINELFIVNGVVADEKAGVLYTDNITNVWTSKEIFSIDSTVSIGKVTGLNLQLFSNMIISVTEINDDCIIATNDNFATVSQYKTNYSALTFYRALTVVFDDKYLLFPVNKLTKATAGSAYTIAAGGFCIMSAKQLPTLAADGYYYYIKAKRTGDE